MTRILALLAFLFLAVMPAVAQDETPAEEESWLVNLLQNQLSTPNRQIRIRGIEGVLSSDATIGEISIADREGIWLRIVNARIDWTRRSLLLGRLQIATLAAERIEITRKPLPEEGLPPPEAGGGFALPELPVSINIDQLDVPRIVFGPTVFGLASELSVNGRMRLADGSLDTALNITRLDGPGGQLTLAATYANETTNLGIDLQLQEPANGIVANTLAIEGRPPVNLAIQGNGPLEQFDLSVALDAAGQRILSGATQLRRQDLGLGFSTTLNGPIAALIPEQYRPFFGANTDLVLRGVAKDAGGMRLDELTLQSAQMRLRALAETAADNFLQRLTVDAEIDNGSGDPILLPAAGRNTIDGATLKVSFGDTAGDEWSGNVTVRDLRTESFSSEEVALTFSGLAQNLQDIANRRVSFNVTGGARGLDAQAQEVAEALGREITLDIAGDWRANQPIDLQRAQLAGNGLSVALDGQIADTVFNGNIAVNAQSIVPFSSLAGRDLAGALRLAAQGTIAPIGGAFDLMLDGSATGLALGSDAADRLLDGETRITGGVARGEQGLVARQFRLFNEQLDLNADGRFATGEADFNFDMALSDLALLSEQASGRVTANGRAQGADGTIRLNFDANVPLGRLMGKTLTDARIGFDGTQLPETLSGALTGNAFLDGNRVELSSDIAVSEETRSLNRLSFTAGGAQLTGNLQQIVASGLFDGIVELDASDISTAASLGLVQASGAVDATIRLRPVNGNQDGDVNATIRNLEIDTTRVGQADIQAEFSDLFKVIGGNATINARDISAGGVDVTSIQAQARQNADTTDFEADTALGNGTTARVAGALSRVNPGFRVGLTELALAQGDTRAQLLQPAALTIVGQEITIDGLALDVGGGRVDANGRIADVLDLDVTIARLPLSIGNTVVPDLGLGGTIDGTVAVGGARDAPDVNFDIRGQGLTARQLREAGIQSLGIAANGRSQGQTLTLDASVNSPEGLQAQARGNVPLGGDGQLALDVTLGNLPLVIANAVVPDQNLAGTISGSARVTGQLAKPAASFNLAGNGISARPLTEFGVAPLTIRADGAYGDNAVTLNSLQVNGAQGLTVSGNGRIPLAGDGLSVNVDAQAPLALANRFLADRGTQLAGTVNANATVTGSIAQPNIQGRVTSAGASVVDPDTNLRVNNINVAVGIAGQTVTIESVTGAIGGGGTVSASGTIGIAPGSNYPANIAINLDNARYADGELLVATVNGRLTVGGALLQDPAIGGTIDVTRAEITVPESFAGGAAAIDVKHRNPSRAVRETLVRAKANDGTPVPNARPSVATVNITINAPNQVFVRGRGLDAELGGSVQITGPVTNIQPVGGLQMIRGRVGILGQRITFTEGEVTLVGDLDPYLNFVAQTDGSDITVFVRVTGRASDIDINFSSQPELPQDEVLARLIFNRGINELSAFQIAQLAAAAAELAGGGNNSLLGSLRAGTGLDDLDVVTDSEGNAAVRAGRYINDNIYLGVEAGAGGNTKATINLDITDDFKVKGAAGTSDSSVGVFYEKDY